MSGLNYLMIVGININTASIAVLMFKNKTYNFLVRTVYT